MEKVLQTAKILWAGKMPLRPAFWIYGFTGGLLFKWAMRVLAASDFASSPLYSAMGILAVIYSGFAAIVVWKSASRFEGDAGWAWAARMAVVVWPTTIFWGP